MSEIKSYEEVEQILGVSSKTWEKLVGYIRFNYKKMNADKVG